MEPYKPKEKNHERTIPLNGVEVGELLKFKNICAQHPEKADRNPALVTHWEGGSRSRIEFKVMTVHLGGDDEFNPMQMFLATLAACDVDLIAMHASFLGLKIESLSVEAAGHFNVRSYLGLDGPWFGLRQHFLHGENLRPRRDARSDRLSARAL